MIPRPAFLGSVKSCVHVEFRPSPMRKEARWSALPSTRTTRMTGRSRESERDSAVGKKSKPQKEGIINVSVLNVFVHFREGGSDRVPAPAGRGPRGVKVARTG